MKKLFLAAASLIFSLHSAYAQDMHSRMDSVMNYFANEYNFNGVVLVASKGNIILEKAYGYKDIAKKEKNDDGSIFEAGTINNPLTAEIIFQLAKEHKLDLDDKLDKYFPKFPKSDSITIRNLLTHTSGIMDYFMFDGMLIKNDTLPMKEDSVIAMFTKRKPQGVPGTHMRYSNSDYMMLGYIIEKVTKKNYSEVFRERIFKPAGMTHSGFDYRGLKNDEKTSGYRHYGEDEKKMVVFDSTITGASASLYSTANDLYSWHKALQSYKLLDKKTQDSMYMPSYGNYAYGWYVDTISQYNKISVVHGGQASGYASVMIRIVSDDFCIILLQNINFPAYDNYGISRFIINAFYDKNFTMPQPIPEVPLTTKQLAQYTGDYTFSSGVKLVVTIKDDSMLFGHNIPLKGDPPTAADFSMTPIGDNKFKTKNLNAIVEFQQDNTGNITQLVLHQPEEPHQHRRPIVAKKVTDKDKNNAPANGAPLFH